MADTKKVLQTGRFGSRYGRGIRTRVLKVEIEQRKRHECPFCDKSAVKRHAAGWFFCTSCDAQFAGGAYVPTTMTGRIINRTIHQKQFNMLAQELEVQRAAAVEKSERPKQEKKEKREKKASKPKAMPQADAEGIVPEEING